jgi:hypothetical protein
MEIDKQRPNHENDMTEFERRLAAWRPAGGTLNRDRMLYSAGRAAAQAEGQNRFWRLATAALVLMSTALAGLLARERSQRFALEKTLVIGHGPAKSLSPAALLAQTPATESLAPNSYFELTAHLMASDLEASALAVGNDFKPTKPAPSLLRSLPTSLPLRPRDLNRVLDL